MDWQDILNERKILIKRKIYVTEIIEKKFVTVAQRKKYSNTGVFNVALYLFV